MDLVAFSKTLMDGVNLRVLRHHFAVGVLIAYFIICFTFRLIPNPESDRAIFVSVAEYLLSGKKLYVDIYDNKDPLFFYAVAMQRSIGVLGEYLFEFAMVVMAAMSVANIFVSVEPAGFKYKGLLLIAVPLLVTGEFWMPGITHLPATALSLLACSLFLRGKMVLAGGCIGLVAFTKFIAFPLPFVFCLSYEVISWDNKASQRTLKRLAFGFILVSMLIITVLFLRHELFGYLQAQQNNFLYSNSVLIDNSSLTNAFVSRLRTMFLGSSEQRFLLFTLMASMMLAGYVAAQPGIGKKRRAFVLSTLATAITSILILGFTGIWSHHLQLVYFPQALTLIYVVASFHSRKDLTHFLSGVIIIVLAILLSGTLSLDHYITSLGDIRTKFLFLTQESSETKAFRSVYPNGAEFARLGQNHGVIPHGTTKDKLLCPEFHQYFFYSTERLKGILDCIKTSPTLVIDTSFSRYDKAPDWWPRDSQKQIILENWNNFVTAGESIVKARYSCKKFGDVRICDSLAE